MTDGPDAAVATTPENTALAVATVVPPPPRHDAPDAPDLTPCPSDRGRLPARERSVRALQPSRLRL